MNDHVYYIAGPMSYRPQFNFPLFDEVASRLRSVGRAVVSPAELDSDAVRHQALASPDGVPQGRIMLAGQTWGDFLARDVKLIADEVTHIVLLPGWETSRGARLEAFVGLLCDKWFRLWRNGALYPVDSAYVQENLPV